MKDKPKKTPRSGRKTAAEAASRAGKSAKHGRATAQPAPQAGKAMPKAGTAADKPRTVRLGQFREDPDNVSVATDEEISRLAGKLKRVPLGLTAMRIAYVTDAPGGGCMVVSGNKRLRCLKAAYGEDGEVPAEWFQDITAMSEAERHEFRLNANISDGHFDLDKLLAQYDTAELSEAGLDELLEGLPDEGAAEGQTDADAVPEVEEEPKSRRGEIYQCGEHRLMCGDATSAEDVARLMGGGMADICFTSPPYNMARSVINKPSRTMKGGRAYGGFSDSLTDGDYTHLIECALKNALSCVDDAMFNIGILMGSKQGILNTLHDFRKQFCDIIVWKKDRAIPLGFDTQFGQLSHCCELVFCFNSSGRRNFAHAQWDKKEISYNVIETENNVSNAFGRKHRAAFPVSFALEALKRFSESSVLDLFGGTGTTMIAAQKLDRRCYMMEIDPHYCDVIRRRWAEFVHGEGCDWQKLTPKIDA